MNRLGEGKPKVGLIRVPAIAGERYMFTRILVAFGIALSGILFTAPGAHAAELWRYCFTDSYGRRICHVITSNTPNDRAIAYRDSVYNGRNYAISGTCQASTSKTFSWSVALDLEAKFKVPIVGGIQAKVNGTAQRATTTGYVTSAEFTVPAHDTVYCDRGTVREWVQGYSTICKSGYCRVPKWQGQAPTRARWWIY